jgi:hypothetical protein
MDFLVDDDDAGAMSVGGCREGGLRGEDWVWVFRIQMRKIRDQQTPDPDNGAPHLV